MGAAGRIRLSADFEVLRRFLAAIADDFVLNRLPLIKSAQAGPLDCGNMDKDVLAAALRLNKAVSLGRVESLYVTRGHRHFS